MNRVLKRRHRRHLKTRAEKPEYTIDKQEIDFELVEWYAKRADAAYRTKEEIHQTLPNTILVETSNQEVQYILEQDHDKRQQIISIRGTANLQNVRDDAEYLHSKNEKLDIWVHSGFDENAWEIYQAILPKLDKALETILTGHSLGAAISTLLMMYLHEDGFNIGTSINFGQPKLTNKSGAKKYEFLPLVRIVDENDPVPLVPPIDLIDAIHGGYLHLGEEVIILEDQYYVYRDEPVARKSSIGSFWKNIGRTNADTHRIAHYIKNIRSKLEKSEQVPFKDRKKYYDE